MGLGVGSSAQDPAAEDPISPASHPETAVPCAPGSPRAGRRADPRFLFTIGWHNGASVTATQ